MIQVHYSSGLPYWLAEQHVEKIESHEVGGSRVHMVNGNLYHLQEDPEALVALINRPAISADDVCPGCGWRWGTGEQTETMSLDQEVGRHGGQT